MSLDEDPFPEEATQLIAKLVRPPVHKVSLVLGFEDVISIVLFSLGADIFHSPPAHARRRRVGS